MVKVVLQNLERPRISIAIEGIDSPSELKGVKQYRHFGRLMKFLTLASEIQNDGKKIYVNKGSLARYLLEKRGESTPISSNAIKQLLNDKKLNFKKIDKNGLEQICFEVFKVRLVPDNASDPKTLPLTQLPSDVVEEKPAPQKQDISSSLATVEPLTPSVPTKKSFFERMSPGNLAIKTQDAIEALDKIIIELEGNKLPENEFTRFVQRLSQSLKASLEHLSTLLREKRHEDQVKRNLISLYNFQDSLTEVLKEYKKLLSQASDEIKPLYTARLELFKKAKALISPLLEVDLPEDIGNIDKSPLSNEMTLQKLHELKTQGVKRGIILGRPYHQNLPERAGWKWCGLDGNAGRYNPDGADKERLQLTMFFENLNTIDSMKMLFNEVVIDYSTIKFFREPIKDILKSMIRLLEPVPETTLIFEFDQKFETEQAYHLLRRMGFSEVQLNVADNFPYRHEFGMGEYKGFIQAKGLRHRVNVIEAANFPGVEVRVKQILNEMKDLYLKLSMSSPPDFQWRGGSFDEALKEKYMSQKIKAFEEVFGWLYDTKDHESEARTSIKNQCTPLHLDFLNRLVADYQSQIDRFEGPSDLKEAYQQRSIVYGEFFRKLSELSDELNIIEV